MPAARKRAPNKSVEEPLVAAARELARGQRGRFSRLELIELLTRELEGEQRRARRQLLQAVVSRLVAAGFFQPTNEHGVLRFRRVRAPLPWDAFTQEKRLAAIEHIRSRLRRIARMSQAERTSPGMAAIRRNLASRLRRLETRLATP